MNKSFILLAAVLLTVSTACTSRTARREAPQEPIVVTNETTIDDSDTVSGTPQSLGAPSSGRGH